MARMCAASKIGSVLVLACFCAWGVRGMAAAAETSRRDPGTPARELVVGPYDQEFAEVGDAGKGLPSPDVRALAFDSKGRLWAGTAKGVAVREGGSWRALPEPAVAVNCLLARGDEMLAGSGRGLHLIGAKGVRTLTAPGRWGPVTALARDANGRVIAACALGMWIVQGDQVEAVAFPPTDNARDVALVNGEPWFATPTGLLVRRGADWAVMTKQGSGLISDDVRALATDPQGTLWVATAEGISLMHASGFGEKITSQDGLPYDDLTCIALGPDGSRWFGSALGVSRLKAGEWRYYFGRRYLAGDKAQAMVVDKDGTAWIGTDTGLSRIYTRQMTLEDKCAFYEDQIAQRHNRRGYVAGCGLARPGDLSSWVHITDDNDGLWTAIYVGAEAFRCAVTQSPQARELARKSVYALMDLVNKTGIPGFPARSYVLNGELPIPGGEWHPDAAGKGMWKGDTSSDELDGHYFGYTVYYDLVANDQEKADLRRMVRAITDHLIQHGYYLVDVDGQPTTWGIFAPEMLNGPWRQARGLNSLEILSHLKVAYHMTGDEKYQQAYLDLARTHHYALNTIYQKRNVPGRVNHSDDELAFLSYYPLLLYETDPDLRAIYLRSLERSWQIERPERCPLWNFIYGADTGKACDAEAAAETLREIPVDQVQWTVRNSQRKDLPHDPAYSRHGEAAATVALRADERRIMKWNDDPYALDDNSEGRGEEAASYYLLPYWMGRYHGIIREK